MVRIVIEMVLGVSTSCLSTRIHATMNHICDPQLSEMSRTVQSAEEGKEVEKGNVHLDLGLVAVAVEKDVRLAIGPSSPSWVAILSSESSHHILIPLMPLFGNGSYLVGICLVALEVRDGAKVKVLKHDDVSCAMTDQLVDTLLDVCEHSLGGDGCVEQKVVSLKADGKQGRFQLGNILWRSIRQIVFVDLLNEPRDGYVTLATRVALDNVRIRRCSTIGNVGQVQSAILGDLYKDVINKGTKEEGGGVIAISIVFTLLLSSHVAVTLLYNPI